MLRRPPARPSECFFSLLFSFLHDLRLVKTEDEDEEWQHVFAFTLVIASHLEIDLSRVSLPIPFALYSLVFSKFLLPPHVY